MVKLSLQDARRLAIVKQHLDGGKRPSLLNLIRDLGCLQLDPISHIAPTHELVLWSRLGNFDHAELDRLRWVERSLFEYWAHAASIVLTEEFPIHDWKMRQVLKRPNFDNLLKENPELVPLRERILAQLKKEKAVFSRHIEEETQDPNWDGRWHSARYTPRLLSAMWDRGETAVVGREGKQRQWGLLDEFLPDWTPREMWTDEQVCRHAIQRSLMALGVATVPQIKKHYTRRRYPKMTAVLKKLLKEEVLFPAQIEGESEPLAGEWLIHAENLPILEAIQKGQWQPKTTLLSPFDNLICDRDRTELLWNFYFRIEIYVPKVKRQFGYYVLPILHGDRLIGRVDSKFDRKRNTYQVHQIYAEPGAPEGEGVVTAVTQTLHHLANFLGAEQLIIDKVPPIWQAIMDR